MAVNKELLKGCSKLLVLKLLSREAMHGYKLSTKLKEVSQGKIEITEGTIYPLLHALESDEAITSSWCNKEGGRKKKTYQITTKGKKILKTRTEEWNEFISSMDLLLTGKVFLA